MIHFVFGLEKDFGDKPFGLSHYLAVKSASVVNKPDKIYFFYRFEPTGEWWEKAKPYIEPVQISVPRKIFGNKLYHFAHKADVIRLLVLGNYGGIYLDMDTICIKPLSSLLTYAFVLGEQYFHGHAYGLCNAVILSEKESHFLKIWYSTYKFFRSKGRDEFWDEHSVRIPLALSKDYSDNIHIEPYTSFFNPSCAPQDIINLFEKNESFPESYLFHLWESLSYDKYLSKLTPQNILEIDTTYNVIARRFLD